MNLSPAGVALLRLIASREDGAPDYIVDGRSLPRLEAAGYVTTTEGRGRSGYVARVTDAGLDALNALDNPTQGEPAMPTKQTTAEALAEANAAAANRLDRAICPTCDREVALRKGGEFREHNNAAGEKCEHSGQVHVPGPTVAAGAVEQPDADQPADEVTLTLSLEAQAIADRRPGGAFSGAEAMVLTVDQIDLDPTNPRGVINPNDPAVLELAASVAVRGVLQPVIVYPVGDRYQLVAGHRRVVAARIAGVPVPALVRKDYADAADLAKVDQIVENLQRENLTPLQEAHAFEALRKAGLKQTDIALAAGINQGTVSKRLALLKLPADVREQVEAGTVDVHAAVELSKLPADTARAAAKSIAGGHRTDSAITIAKAAGQREAAVAAAVDEAVAAGLAVIDYPVHGYWHEREDAPLRNDDATVWHGRPPGCNNAERVVNMTAKKHAAEPCHGIAIGYSQGAVVSVPVCLDPSRHGPSVADVRAKAQDKERAKVDAEHEAEAAARRAEDDARWAATRRVVAAKLSRPTMVDTIALWTVEAMLADEYNSTAVDRNELDLTLDLLEVDRRPSDDASNADDYAVDDLQALIKVDGAVRVAFVACLAAGENVLGSRWRLEGGHPLMVNHFALLAEHGDYTLTEADLERITPPVIPPTPAEVLAMAGDPAPGAVAFYVADLGADPDDESRWVTDQAEAAAMADIVDERLVWLDGHGPIENTEENQGGEHDDTSPDDDAALAAAADAAHDAAEGPQDVPDASTPPDAVDATSSVAEAPEAVPCGKSGKLLPKAQRGPRATCPVCLQSVGTDDDGKLVNHERPAVPAKA